MKLAKFCLGLLASMSLTPAPVETAGLLYDGVLQYWHADMSGHAGQTDAVSTQVDAASDGIVTFGFRLGNGRSLLEVLYTRLENNGLFSNPNLGTIFAKEQTGAGLGGFRPNVGDYVNFNIDKVDVHLKHPLVDGNKMALRVIAGLTWVKAHDDLQLPLPGNQRAKADFESLLGVGGMEFEYYLDYRSSLRGSYRYGREVSEDYARLKQWEASLVYAPEDMLEFELGYKSLSLKSKFFEGSAQEWELEREFKGPYAQMSVLF